MQRYGLVTGVFFWAILLAVLLSTPALAITAKQKMETCKFGADHPMLAGKQRAEFLKKCMSDKNDPRGPSSSGTPGPGTKPN